MPFSAIPHIFINIFPILSFSYGPQRPTASGLVKKKIGASIIFIWPTAPHCLWPSAEKTRGMYDFHMAHSAPLPLACWKKKQGHVFYSIICPLVQYLTHMYILKLFPIPSFSYGPQRPTASGLLKKIRGVCLNQLYALWCHTSHKYIFINISPILSFSYGPPRPTASGLVKKKK